MTSDELPDERALVPYAASRFDARRVLVLAPHPDDEVFGCGGALADLASRGATIDVLLVTDGAAGAADEAGRRAIAARRADESRVALGLLGGGAAHEGGLPDRGLGGRAKEVEELLASWLVQAEPDLVFCPSPVETHPDHRAVAYALLALARRPAQDPAAAALARATVAFFEVSQPFRPNFLVDVTPFLERKRKAVLAFASQAVERDYASFVDGLNAFRRMTLPARVAAAEAYAVFPGALLADPAAVLGALLPVGPRAPLGLRERLGVLFSGRLP
ncbi:MAG: PIG-L family deacetylase [Holophagales bacterium]|nr:PIG-L family deacetylase [Holophagales bacterium]